MSTDPIVSEISALAARLERYKDSPLSRSLSCTGSQYEKGHRDMISRNFISGYMWHYLFDTLIRPKFPTVSLWWNRDKPYELERAQKAYILKLQHIDHERKDPFLDASWSIQEFTGRSNVIKEYRLRKTYGDWYKEQEIVKGLPTWKMQVHMHQETTLDLSQPVAFEGALVFDMLLGLVTGNFQPHTKSIEEGPALQLEILCALEKVQKESMDAVNTGSGKRKLSVQERLDGKKRMKTE